MPSKIPKTKKERKLPKLRPASLKKLVTLNIGTIIFSAIFIYMVISFILYLTATHISSYQVTAGTLSKNPTFTALALREETVYTAESDGYISYYVGGNTRVQKDGVVYGIGASQDQESTRELSSDDLAEIRSQAANYSANFDSTDFQSIYNFKYSMEGDLLQYSGYVPSSGSDTVAAGGRTIVTAPDDGLVVYTADGYEEYTEDTLTEDCFNQKSYSPQNLKTTKQVSAGDPVYKLVTSEEWSILIPLTDRQTVALASNSTIRVKFLKDGSTQVGSFSLMKIGEQRVGKITFENGMVRYADDRFLEVELVVNTQSGLKIPVSSIVQKEFYTVPTEYETSGGDDNNSGFFREVTDKDGNTTTEFVEATLYAEDEEAGVYYVEKNVFEEGDVLVQPNSTNRYTISSTASLEGVYCINKGYAVFRKISIISQNEEYCIVEEGTTFGIAQYDYIVRDGSQVKEEEILY